MLKIVTLEDIYIDRLKEIYSAEIQLIEVLPKMIQAAHDPKLKIDFQHHLELTYRHVERIEQILENRGQIPTGRPCDVMLNLVNEGKRSIREHALAPLKDAALIQIAQRIERYEIAGYECARTYASLLDDDVAVDLLQATLNEESELARGLTIMDENLHVAGGGGEGPSFSFRLLSCEKRKSAHST